MTEPTMQELYEQRHALERQITEREIDTVREALAGLRATGARNLRNKADTLRGITSGQVSTQLNNIVLVMDGVETFLNATLENMEGILAPPVEEPAAEQPAAEPAPEPQPAA